ncbi:protein FAM50A [Chiloscyllium plagiosum]|uniref:protein FAM50A n=1 Tax=Chiloscyllium plagiosum TaxID=36176 RepID=UPI001CB83CE3|nr:protein FAM50A [Chiloscyllium plagiosum]
MLKKKYTRTQELEEEEEDSTITMVPTTEHQFGGWPRFWRECKADLLNLINHSLQCGKPDLLKNVREKNRVLQDQNNILQLKLELVMDMLTESTAGLLLMEEEEEETEGKEKEKKEEEEEEEEAEEELEELEMKTCPKKLPKPISAYDLESSDYEYDEELLTSQWRNRYSMPTLSFDDESEYSEEVVYTKRPQDKPKVCPMKRAARAKARSRANIRQSSGARSLLPPKTRSSSKVCKLELEPEPKPKTCPRRKPKPKPKSVRQTDGVCPMKKGSKI